MVLYHNSLLLDFHQIWRQYFRKSLKKFFQLGQTTFLIIPGKALSSIKDKKQFSNLLRIFKFSKNNSGVKGLILLLFFLAVQKKYWKTRQVHSWAFNFLVISSWESLCLKPLFCIKTTTKKENSKVMLLIWRRKVFH